MPARWLAIAISIFWLLMTAWLVQRDILPRMGFGDVTYQAVLANRAVADPANWTLKIDDQSVGSLLTLVEPQENGSYHIIARGNLNGLLSLTQGEKDEAAAARERSALPDLQMRSRIFVSSLGRLEGFTVALGIQGIARELEVTGTVSGQELHLQASGLPVLEGETRLAIDPEAIVLDQFGPMNRLPSLSVGKTWTTRAVNPLAAFLAQSSWLGGAGNALELVHHTVEEVETTDWNGQAWPCFVVRHEHKAATGKSWVRTSDGLVLRQEAPFGGSTIVFEQLPPENE